MRFLSRLFKPAPGRTMTPHDMHCHLLPGVDDGVKTFDDALHCLQSLQHMGYTGATLTPHIYPEVFDNNEADLRQAFTSFQHQMAQALPGFHLALAAEYFCCDGFRRTMHDALPSLLTAGRDRRVILIEFGSRATLDEAGLYVHDLLQRSLRPMLAHVERYPFLHTDAGLDQLRQWRSQGVIVQMNAGSPAGQYGQTIKAAAVSLLNQGLVDAIGTDLHKPSQLPSIERGWGWLASRRDRFASLRDHFASPDDSLFTPSADARTEGQL